MLPGRSVFRAFVFTAFVLILVLGAVLNIGALDCKAENSCSLRSSVLGAAGARVSSSALDCAATLAQPTPSGVGSSDSFTINAGFWTPPSIMAGVLAGPDLGSSLTRLYENYPNPFTSTTTVAYSLARQSDVEIAIFDVEGRKVRTLVNENMSSGPHYAFWDGSDSRGRKVGPGVYFYRLSAGSHVCVKKMIFVR